MLRLAFIHLTRTIDSYKAVAARNRIQGHVSRESGRGDASVAIDIYLEAKRRCSGEDIRRSRLLDYYRAGKRWSLFAIASPISVLVFSPVAETIVQNHCITDSTLRALAVQVRQNHPELVRALDKVGQHAGFGTPSTMQGIPRMEDVVARTNEILGPILHRLYQGSRNSK